MMKNILILCTGNSCRSQMAHGYLQRFAGDTANVFSAGIEVHGVNPLAIETMKAAGIDISQHTSNHVDEYKDVAFDYVITVCDHAREQCPYFPARAQQFHHNFPDPARAVGSAEEVHAAFRQVREMIRDYCERFVQENLLR